MRKEKSARVIRRIACFDLAALVILSAAFLAV